MNDGQVLERLQTILQSHRWTTGAEEPLFHPGSVLVSPRQCQDVLRNVTPPLALLRLGAARADPELKGMKWADIVITLAAAVPGDPYGESTMTGWNREEGKTEGMGLPQLQSEMFRVLGDLSIADGIEMKSVLDGYPLPSLDDQTNYIVERDYTFKAMTTTLPRYQRPEAFTATVVGSAVHLAWANPHGGAHLGYSIARVSSATGTAYRTAANEITAPVSTDLAYIDAAPGTGVWTYSLFAGYHTQPNESIIELYSDCPQVTVEVP